MAHLRIHSHCDLSKGTGARLERLQPRIDGLEGAVDASSDMWGTSPCTVHSAARVRPRWRNTLAPVSSVLGVEIMAKR